MNGVLAATLMLPGLAAVSLPADGETAPEQGEVAFRLGYYKDGQPDWERITVRSPQLHVLLPLAGEWAIDGAALADGVSGATPRMHTFRSGATPYMSDQRRAADVRVTRYLARGAVTLGTAYSTENDYTSRAFSLGVRWSSDDNNRTWSLGLATSGDVIDTTRSGGAVSDQHRRTNELLAGLTQVLTMDDIVQLTLTRTQGRGYFSDPYKDFDQRPDFRNANAAVIRWNHNVDRFDASLRTSYRYYRDTFGVKSYTVSLEWVQPAGAWTVTPGVRYYTQGAASFYFDPVPDAQGQASHLATIGYAVGLTSPFSADQRLAGFGALSASLKISYAYSPQTSVDVKLEQYRQSAGLKSGGAGSPYLDPFRARLMLMGIVRKF